MAAARHYMPCGISLPTFESRTGNLLSFARELIVAGGVRTDMDDSVENRSGDPGEFIPIWQTILGSAC